MIHSCSRCKELEAELNRSRQEVHGLNNRVMAAEGELYFLKEDQQHAQQANAA